MNTNTDTIISIIESPNSCLKAKLLILLWKELAEGYLRTDWATLNDHIYYRALDKIPSQHYTKAFKELPKDETTDYLENLLS